METFVCFSKKMDACFCCFNWLAKSENCFQLSQTIAKKNLFWPSCICLSRHWDFMVAICVPYIHCTVKLGKVAGDCKSKGDTTPLNFAKFDTACLSQCTNPGLCGVWPCPRLLLFSWLGISALCRLFNVSFAANNFYTLFCEIKWIKR